MLLIENILGNRQDAGWQERLAGLHVDMLALDQWEAQKNRLRKKTVAGVEIALALPRQSHLHDGDVLFYDEAAGEVIAAIKRDRDEVYVDRAKLLPILMRVAPGVGERLMRRG